MNPTPKFSWQLVAFAALGVAGFLGLFAIIPEDEAQLRSTLLGLLVTTVGALVAFFVNRNVGALRNDVQEVKQEVATVVEQTNGNTQALLNKIPDQNLTDVERDRRDRDTPTA